MKQDCSNSYIVPMLAKSMELLELLSKHHNGLTLQELVDKLHYSKTTVFRIVATLLDLDYIGKEEERNSYFISRKLFKLGISALGEKNIVERAIEPMTRLRDEVKESVMLGAMVENKVVLLEQVMGSHAFTFCLKSGTAICLHASAPGKVLVAAMSDEKRDKVIKSIDFIKFNEHTILTEESFVRELELTKERGYGMDVGEEIVGVHCVGAPIYNQYGDAIASVWISAPKGRLPLDSFDSVGSKVKVCADRISEKLGFKLLNIK